MAEGDGLGIVRAVICEDEPLALRAMQEYLKDVEWVQVVDTASDGRAALRVINKHDPDLVFLDVRMPGLTGIEVLEALEDKPAVVFTTAFDEYAVSAFDHGAVDYLVKPFGRDRLVRTLDRVRVRLVGEGGAGRRTASAGAEVDYVDRLFARHRGAMIPIAVSDVSRLTAADGGVEVHTDRGVYTLDSTLGEVEQRLDPKDFVRVHRAHLVHLGRVRRIGRYDERRLVLTLDDDSTIVASRKGSQSLRGMMAS
ncbi:MAG: LytTR family DNA-binding domain-containing protein [Gemmatimonadota bacterium]